jgi:branched-chain amino acid aminotransferase
MIRFLTTDGLQPAPYTADSLVDAAKDEPSDGVYTITNTYNITQVLKLDAHLDRMEDSARRSGMVLKLDRPRLRTALREMILASGYGDVRFRITAAPSLPETLIMSIEPFTPLAESVYADGVKVITLQGAARHNPAAKTTDWMQDRQQIEKALPASVFTGLLVSENGAILEGLSSNFYAILNGELRTAGEGVLAGIAQQIVFEVAPAVLPGRRDAVNVTDIPHLSEAFITSASRGIVPVVQIDEVTLGDGKPGERTRQIRERYLVWVKEHLEAL